ncbi:hypothetical protein CHS0354_023669 [Potamilus streckersoni]|uniref:Inner centromere protein ARK-binding domain-containing protein n=1 Tax=Potamilus streckersoni TaxID=2493646 RepID=A0AAE0SY69_9BIVA|nr:hypothetical protein CHS0354_023669 [Potamilus streckersoni]
MADPTFTIGFQTGQTIRLMVEDIFQRLEEDAFTYLSEILVVAKKTFKSSKIEVLPKTPAAKESRRKVLRRKIEEINEEDEENEPPAKRRSLHPEADNSRDDFASPRKHTRVTRAATRAATTSQAKKKRSMGSKEQTYLSKKNKSSPIVCIEKLVQQETLELEKRVTTENNSCFTPVENQSKQSCNSQNLMQNICLMNIKPKAHAYEEVIHLHENDAGHQSHGTTVASTSRKFGEKTDRRSSYRSGSVRRSSRNRNISHIETPKSGRRSSTRTGVRKSLKMLKSHQALKKNEKLEKKLTSDEEKMKDEESNMDAATDDESHDNDDVPKFLPADKIIHPASLLNNLNKHNTKSTLRPANVATTIARTFIKRITTPSKPTMEDKRKAIEEKERLHEEILKKREKQYQTKIEELKRKREERMKKVEKQREKQHAEENKHRMLLTKKMQQKEQLLESLREDRLREDKEKQKIRQQKLQEAEERRLQEQKEREKKLQEQQEEERRHQELLQKRKELEELERQKKFQEENQKMKDKLTEIEREREAEAEKLRQLEEEKEREWQKKKEEREKMLAQERTEKERIELEKKRERELQMKKELEKQKELEKKRFEDEEQENEKEKQREEDLKKLLNKHNVQMIQKQQQQQDAITQGIPKPNLNEMLTSTEPQIPSSSTSNPTSYQITPIRMHKKSRSQDNYDISDLHSSDSTDNEEAPRKIIPLWAQGVNLKAALINQHYHPPNLEKMFPYIEPPDLNVFFEKKRPRFNKRTSSAHWDSPVLPPYKI